MLVACVCVLLEFQHITAVVNNVQKEGSTAASNLTSSNSSVGDSVAASSEFEANRRDAPVLTNSYGDPIPSNSYGPPLQGNSLLPQNPIPLPNIDSLFPPSALSSPQLPNPVYGVPSGPSTNVVYPAPPPDIPPALPAFPVSHGSPQETYGLPKPQYGLPSRPAKPFIKFPKPVYGPPRPQYGPPPKPLKPLYGPPPSFQYGAPLFSHYKPRQIYGLPKTYGPPLKLKPAILPPKPLYGPPRPVYGPPLRPLPLKPQYGPPEPVPHGPPHPGAPAPPTPPDIKYDGWQPIPGLVSRPPADIYGVPKEQHHGFGIGHLQLVPPQPSSSYGTPHDSYGAPLNTVTGSGGTISSSGDSVHDGLTPLGLSSPSNDLSVVKSVGFEIFANGGLPDSYGAPPANSYAPTGPYAAGHSYKTFGAAIGDLGVGLIPPSGVYGAPPSGQYGTPLLGPPRNPVAFREPVPQGLIQSFGEPKHNYGPPSVPEPSSLFSLPTHQSPTSFQSVVHGSSGLNIHGATAHALTSYTAPLGVVDGNYGGATVRLESPPPATIDLTHLGSYSQGGNDCSHKSQLPLSISNFNLGAPSLNYGPPDSNIAHSQLSENFSEGSNSLPDVKQDGEVQGKSLLAQFEPGSQLIKSQSIDLNNIPLQGALGSYTLQIQSADGQGQGIPHTQVLNDGLLQSILNAIEQPQQLLPYNVQQLPSEQTQHFNSLPSGPGAGDSDGQYSVTKAVAVTAPPESSGQVNPQRPVEDEANLRLMDHNDVALYFNNPEGTDLTEEKGTMQVTDSDVQNAQQYGSYVSFKSANSSYDYSDNTQSTTVKAEVDASDTV